MAVRGQRLTADLIAEVVGIAGSKLKPDVAPLAQEFVRRFYAHVPPSDILGVGAETLYGAALSMLHFASDRPPGTAKVRVYKPTLSEDGWESTHTVVQVVNDDMPFLVDSVTAELNQRGHTVHLVIHPIIPVTREAGRIETIGAAGGAAESVMHVEMDEVTNLDELDSLRTNLVRVLADVRVAVEDWQAIRDRLRATAADLTTQTYRGVSTEEAGEAAAFLQWLDDNHFTFLGCRDYRFEGGAGELKAVPESGSSLGILRSERLEPDDAPAGLAVLPAAAIESLNSPILIDINKANARSTVHRPVHMDYVTVKRFDADGRVVGVRRFLGLFTSVVYNSSPRRIPILRHKVARVVEEAGFAPNSHDEKALVHILEAYPRDELFQIGREDLLETALGILHLQERQRIALFTRADPFQRFVSCLVYAPRDHYNTGIRLRFARILETALSGEVTAFTTQVSDEPLARIQFLVRTTPGQVPDYDPAEIERRLAEAGRSWSDRLQQALVAHLGEERGLAAWRTYGEAFPAGYRETYHADLAVADIALLDGMGSGAGLGMNLYRPIEAGQHELRFKLYHAETPVPLSDILPMLEHMGLRVIGEVPYRLEPEGRWPVWIHDFGLETADRSAVDLRAVRDKFQTAFDRIWTGELESDGMNRLILAAGLDWRQIVVLRAFARYLRQVGAPFSQAYMEETLARHAGIAGSIVALFEARFDPARHDPQRAAAITDDIAESLEAVESLDEDRILRRFLNLAEAAVRTNHWQTGTDGWPKPYLSIKYDCAKVEELPLPRPMFEIFVYSARMEGIHLRGGKVARGGIRWSDRREDFRTEVLGLMKAQMVKNAVIVPVGAKGGFVLKRPPAEGGREALQAEGIACYKLLVRGLLDVTDNRDGDTIVPPPDVVRHDGDDPYIVVAADKGTASFSDIANGLSAEYGFWLKDAFASGGSAGYDHKGMGITARGAWESVKRHFREVGRDIQSEDFTCVGVGDMAGDVFGNGMLLSRHTRLVGAFNHLHIFVDPNPDPEASWAERKRLFDLPRSNWTDYDSGLISQGGGVFSRQAKAIHVSAEMKALFDIDTAQVTPSALMTAMLRAQVDLLWFGGIGTFIKSAEETNAEVGDRSNDAHRVNGGEIRAKVVGEGANLGATQRGRIEYALAGGRINTDFIDNSGGVDTSDHEVNIKILLNATIDSGELTLKQRDALLKQMTDEVAQLVLAHNYLQSGAISVTEAEAAALLPQHARFIRRLERAGQLNRSIEFLPDDEVIGERETAGLGLTRPELAVLLSYSKIVLYEELLSTGLPDDPELVDDLVRYFPPTLRDGWRSQIAGHRLRRELVTTYVTNTVVDRAGIGFVERLQDRSGRGAGDVARAFSIAVAAFGLRDLWEAIEGLDNQVPASVQTSMLLDGRRLVEHGTLWFLRHGGNPLDMAAHLEAYRPGIADFCANLPSELFEDERRSVAARRAELQAAGVPEKIARTVAGLDVLYGAPDVVRLAGACGRPVEAAAHVWFSVATRFGLDRLRDAASNMTTRTAWQQLAVETFVDDVFGHQAALTAQVLAAGASDDAEAAVEAWAAQRPAAVVRYDRTMDEIGSAGMLEIAMLTVVNGQLRALAAA